MLDNNGSMIRMDIMESFNNAVANKENRLGSEDNFGVNWAFVESDMFSELSMFYSADYINECFDILADDYENNC